MSTLEDPDDGMVAARPGQAPSSADEATERTASTGAGEEAPSSDTEGSTLERAEPEDPLDSPEITVDPAKVRHAPRFGRFATVGGLAGVALGFLLTPLAQYENLNVSWHFDPWGLGLVLAATLAPVGVLVGCAIALVSDRRSRRKVKS